MARIAGVQKGGGLLARIAFFLCRRNIGKVVQPLRIYALHPQALLGYGRMEQSQLKWRKVSTVTKSLAQTLVAMRVGCPF